MNGMSTDLTFGDMIIKTDQQLKDLLIADRVSYILNDPVMLKEYITDAVSKEIDSARFDRLGLLEELYNMGVWA